MAKIVKTEACATVNSTNGTALPVTENYSRFLLKTSFILKNILKKLKKIVHF